VNVSTSLSFSRNRISCCSYTTAIHDKP
jgi:hypothetical protein